MRHIPVRGRRFDNFSVEEIEELVGDEFVQRYLHQLKKLPTFFI